MLITKGTILEVAGIFEVTGGPFIKTDATSEEISMTDTSSWSMMAWLPTDGQAFQIRRRESKKGPRPLVCKATRNCPPRLMIGNDLRSSVGPGPHASYSSNSLVLAIAVKIQFAVEFWMSIKRQMDSLLAVVVILVAVAVILWVTKPR